MRRTQRPTIAVPGEGVVYEYLAQRLLPRGSGGYYGDGEPPEAFSSVTEAMNRFAAEGWELDRFDAAPTEVWIVFRRSSF